MKKHFLLIVQLFIATIAFAQVKQTVTKSSVTFKIKHMGLTVDGSFGGFKGDIQFDAAHLDASSIEASVSTNTLDTDNGSRDEDIKGDSYFDVAKYPLITLKSISFQHKRGDSYAGTFHLTIKDKTRVVELPFTYTETGNTASFKGSLKIKRSDYGVGGSSFIMSDDVLIAIDVSTNK